MITQHEGLLEIDRERGVIWFHENSNGNTLLRICRLGNIPDNTSFIDVTHMFGTQVVGAIE